MFWLVATLTALGLLRACLLWSHSPVYAYANTYDQVRYSACFDMYPDRPAVIPPDENSPNAPYADFRFASARAPMCYWSSELVFGALTAAIWKVDEALTGDRVHSIRIIGALKLVALAALSLTLSAAWLRRRQTRLAVLNAALLPLLFCDPGNTLYLNTFYAEWSALLAAYAVFGVLALWHGESGSRARFIVIALAAFLLATSKMQHLALPMSLGIAFFVLQRARHGRAGWLAIALLLGGFLGGYFQFVQMQRQGPMMDSIHQYNRAHVIFTALLPLADDKPAFLREIGVDAACAVYSGKHAWEMPDMPERVCPGVLAFGYADQLRVLVTHPLMTLRLGAHAVLALNPWMAENIGQVEGRVLEEIPRSVVTLGVPLQRWPALQLGVLALPLLGCAVLLARRGVRGGGRALDLSVLIVVLMLATLTVTVMGDGLADTAKQGHLAVNAALAWLIAALFASVRRAPGAPPAR